MAGGHGSWRRSAATFVALIVLIVAAPAAQPAGAAAATCSLRSPLPASLGDELAARYPGRRFTVEVFDSASCSYSFNPDARISTASVVKLEFMAGVLLLAQNEGRDLTEWERDQIWPMITVSDNASASNLWNYLGQDAGMQQIDAAFGLTDTQHAGGFWGLTTTSAADQARLVSAVIPGIGGPLTAPYRAEGRYYMTNVIPEQRWGASAGAPAGAVVAQKNGFAASDCCAWRINSVGWVARLDGSGWAIAVLSDGWATQSEGIAAVDELSGRINRAMTDQLFRGASSIFEGSDQQHVFARDTSGAVRDRTWTAAEGFGLWDQVGGFAMSDPDVAQASPDDPPNVFVVGGDSALYDGFMTDDGWSFATLGGICSSGPSAVYSGDDRVDVYCRGSDRQLWTRTWTSTDLWSDWSPMGGLITSDPDAASPGEAADLTVYARGDDDAVWEYARAGKKWVLQSLGGVCTSGPSAVYSGEDRLDLFCRGSDLQLWTRVWTPDGWGPWSPIGGLAASDPDAVSQGEGGSLQVFARGMDGSIWQWFLDGTTWRYQNWSQP